MRLALLSILIILLTVSTGLCVEIGDKAPPLNAKTWINGSAVDPSKPDGKTVYVIEFWATWCPPCKRTIPHLNKLYKEYADKDVKIVGVTIEKESTVRPFLKTMPMDYLVAIDSEKNTADTYMEDVSGIPHAFIVDREGTIVWAGHPLNNMDTVLKEILAGTYNMKQAEASQDLQDQLQAHVMQGEFPEALEVLDKLMAIDKSNFTYYQLKLGLLAQNKDMEAVKKTYRDILTNFSDSAEDLNTLAWVTATSPFAMTDLDIAWEAANRAVTLSKRENSAILDTLARVYYTVGLLPKAIETQKEAISRSDSMEDEEGLKETLRFYEQAVSIAQKITDHSMKNENSK